MQSKTNKTSFWFVSLQHT